MVNLNIGEFEMRRIAELFAIIIALSCVTSVFAESSQTSFDFSSMSTRDIEALDAQIHQELSSRQKGSEGLLTDDNIDSMFEGETELSDESFLTDFASGLIARWELAGADATAMSDKQFSEYNLNLINSELVYIGKYAGFEFADSRLGEYAHAYIKALQSQFIGISEYYGVDDELYKEYYTEDGYYPRTRYIYLINKGYGVDLPAKYADILKRIVLIGFVINTEAPITTALEKELSEVELSFDTTSSSKYIYIAPFNIKNQAPSEIQDLSIKINFINENDVIVDTQYLVSYTSIPKGEKISTNKVMTNEHFSHISYSYSFSVQTSSTYDTFEETIIPSIQYSWDGIIKKNGKTAEGQPVLEIINLHSGWEMNTSWNKTLFVPVLKFDVMNSGTGEAKQITVKVVFTSQSTNQVWDEETTYVISSSDTPLKVGFSKKAFVYSSVGYREKTTPPDLTADIYINGNLVESITVSK